MKNWRALLPITVVPILAACEVSPTPTQAVESRAAATAGAGKEGRRYSIVVRNRRDFRLEIVLSVDGLDVIDGGPASFRKHGYVVDPHRTLVVEGFRQRTEAVAAFRFGPVRESYAAEKYQTTLTTLALSTSPCSTKWVLTRGPAKKCAVA